MIPVAAQTKQDRSIPWLILPFQDTPERPRTEEMGKTFMKDLDIQEAKKPGVVKPPSFPMDLLLPQSRSRLVRICEEIVHLTGKKCFDQNVV